MSQKVHFIRRYVQRVSNHVAKPVSHIISKIMRYQRSGRERLWDQSRKQGVLVDSAQRSRPESGRPEGMIPWLESLRVSAGGQEAWAGRLCRLLPVNEDGSIVLNTRAWGVCGRTG